MYTYPTAIDNPQRVVDLVGGFWTRIFGDSASVINYCNAGNAAEKQLFQDILELQASVGRHGCPVFHTNLWYSLTIAKSTEVVTGSQAAYPIPPEFQDSVIAVNSITTPTVSVAENIDYVFDLPNEKIDFTHSLFNDARFIQTPVIKNGVTVDHTITLWFSMAQLDYQIFYNQFGYIIPLNLPSSQAYKDFTNAILDAYVGGTTYLNFAKALAAIADSPIVLSNGETVQVITTDAVALLIMTDMNVYRFSLAATPVVSVGHVVNAGDQLTDAVSIFEPSNGASLNLTSIILGPGALNMLDSSIMGPLTFNNSDTALVVTPNVSGYTKVSWALGGAGSDVTQFFNVLHQKGIAAGKTLAMLLDMRPQPQSTQPTAASLPATINPMQFLFKNVFRNNAFVVTLKTASFGQNALGVALLPLLRNIVSPNTAAIYSVT